MIFDKDELSGIESAVEELESRFPLEIVPVFVEKSGAYYISRFRALIVAVLSSFVFMFLVREWSWLAWYPLYVTLVLGLLWIICFLTICEFVPAISRALAGKRYLKEKTLKRAKEEYVLQEVYANPQRVGVMIFVGFYEHQFHIICDKKGSKFFGDDEWAEVSKELVLFMKKKEPYEGIKECIKAIGEVMAREIDEDDTLAPSVLPNHIRYDV